ncbi:hypothetical protein V6N13_103048 [Hibiscus sabdariffa]|uniref:MADS-box domain-containing protein n=1 Tax=Hibiscus sabdariffa TaxID=183260 RepID=A0ABR2C5U9_9ROSI
MTSSGKKTRGKQRIDMKIIEKEDEKLVTFSKRRSGIYEKLRNPFSFGHPSIESVANHFFNNNIFPPGGNPHPLGELEVQMVNVAIAAGLLDVGEPIGSSGTSLRVASIRANLRRPRFLPITANLLPKLKNVVYVYDEAIRQMDAAKEIEKTLPGQESGRETNFWWEAKNKKIFLRLQHMDLLAFRKAKNLRIDATLERFELSWGNPMYLACTGLNHSAKASLVVHLELHFHLLLRKAPKAS